MNTSVKDWIWLYVNGRVIDTDPWYMTRLTRYFDIHVHILVQLVTLSAENDLGMIVVDTLLTYFS